MGSGLKTGQGPGQCSGAPLQGPDTHSSTACNAWCRCSCTLQLPIIDDHKPEQWGGWPAGGWGGEELLGKVVILWGLWELQS